MTATQEMFQKLAANRATMRDLAIQARREALPFLVQTMAHQTGQSYKLRALLYSLWNGQPADLSDVLGLDWNLRVALLVVIAAFGFEEKGGTGETFFYEAISTELQQHGLTTWFCEAAAEVASRGRVALTRDLADVQEKLAEMGELQQFSEADKIRWTELRTEEARYWRAIQTLNDLPSPTPLCQQQN